MSRHHKHRKKGFKIKEIKGVKKFKAVSGVKF